MDSELRSLDAALVKAAANVHVLRHVSWPMSVQRQFLARWRVGDRRQPEVSYAPEDLSPQRAELERIAERAGRLGGPVATYVSETARSYADVCRLIASAGTPEASAASIDVYGRPGSMLPGSQRTNLDAADYFVEVSREVSGGYDADDEDDSLSAEEVAANLRKRIGDVITRDEIKIVVDPALASKAAAGATRIRLRDGTRFSTDDVDQLLEHEAFVHSLTALNGRRQPNLTSLSLGAPRTTATQEGLATFAELVTGAIDIARMKRIALRVNAIDMALSGAGFVEVFEFFLECGQPEVESFNSTMRVFRGMPLDGGHAFTKDVVYLTGLIQVHTYFRWALRSQQLHFCEALFAGRMTLSDAQNLEPAFADGTIVEPAYLPPWMTRKNGLTAYLAFSVFADHISVAGIAPEEFHA